MHELGLAEAVLGQALDIAGGREVRRLSLRIGALQRVVPDSLEFGFRLLAEGTPAETAQLQVVAVPAVLRCGDCEAQTEMASGVLTCSACGSTSVSVVSGGEVFLDEVELGGDPPEVIRRPGLEVVEPPHVHDEEPTAS